MFVIWTVFLVACFETQHSQCFLRYWFKNMEIYSVSQTLAMEG